MTDTVSISWPVRLWRSVAGLFATAHRDCTPEESALRQQVAELTEEITNLKAEIRWQREEIKAQELAIKGLTEVCVYHETRWQAQTAIETGKIALAPEIVKRKEMRG
jgi:hypothetical protein